MIETERTIGKKQYQAAEFLIDLLAEGEKLSAEVYQLAARRGISDKTLTLAKKAAWVKARKANGRWYMFLQEGAREHFADCISKRGGFSAQPVQQSRAIGAVSSDWVTVVANSSDGSVQDTLPPRDGGGLHVKVGAVEFTADSAFPTEKLIEVLRGLGVGNGC